MNAREESGALFVLPTSTSGQQGPVAGWMSTAGWAAAARRVLGSARIITPTGEIDSDDARRRGSGAQLRTSSDGGWRRRIPTVCKTAAKDVRQYRRARGFRVDPKPYTNLPLTFVWQRHELFHTAGLDLASDLRVPSVLFVPATHVWEAEQWGTHRPGWKRLIERYGEAPPLRRADVVACGTDLVVEQVLRLGARPGAIVVTPTGVDVDTFDATAAGNRAGDGVRDRLGLHGRFVVGWVGSFRRFHALEQALAAVAGIEGATLLLVGDGPERPHLERLARDRGVATVFTGTIPHPDLPAYLAAMDVALVLAGRDEVFHYSPLKLGEYLAAGRAVIAPDVPQLSARLTDGVDVVLVPPGDARALAGALRRLHDEPASRARIAAAARETAKAKWSWDHAIRQILAKLGA